MKRGFAIKMCALMMALCMMSGCALNTKRETGNESGGKDGEASVAETTAATEVSLTSEQQEKVNEVQSFVDKFSDKRMNKSDTEEIYKAMELYEALDDACKSKVIDGDVIALKYDELNSLMVTSVISRIDAIYPLEDGSRGVINEAQKYYDELTPEQKALVTNYDVLEGASAEYDKYRADKVNVLIDNLPDEVTYENRVDVFSALSIYEFLSDEQKALVNNKDRMDEAIEVCSNSCKARYNSLIGTVKTVTLDSGDVLYELRDIYNMLPAEAKADLDYSTLDSKLDEYEILKVKATYDESRINKGEKIVNGAKYESEFKSCQVCSRILPANTSGYYWYQEAPDGFFFVDCVFYVKNVSSHSQVVNEFIDDAYLYVDGTKKPVTPYFYMSNSSYLDNATRYDTIPYNSGITTHVVFRITDDEKKNAKSIVMELVVGDESVYAIAR